MDARTGVASSLAGLAGLLVLALAPSTSAQRAGGSGPRFRDVAVRSTVSYITNNDYGPRKYFPQPMCGGVAAFDYDNDGFADLYFTNGAAFPSLRKTNPSFFHCLLRNRKDGTFEDVTTHAGLSGADLGLTFGVAAGDYDNDGWEDLFVAGAAANTLYHNNGDGTFINVTNQSGLNTKPRDTISVQGAWFDYDGDGLLDLVVSNYMVWNADTDKVCTANGVARYCSPKAYPSVAQQLFRNLGHGHFEDVSANTGIGSVPGKGMGIAIADFNNDGYPDVFIANDTERNLLFLNRANGSFREAGLASGVAYNDNGIAVSGMGADAKDFDNDGTVDVFYNDLMGQIWALFKNRDGKTFRYSSPLTKLMVLSQNYSGWSGGFIDYDNDGWKDLYSANGDVDNLLPTSRQHDTLFANRDGRELIDVSATLGADFLRPGYQRGAAFADFNNDGFSDIAVTSLNQKPRILLNTGGQGAHWLTFSLTGSKSNRDGIGTKIKVVTPSGRTLYNEATTSVGFASSSDRRVSFGLGRENRVSLVEIRWPSGTLQQLVDIAVDRIIPLVEPR